MKVTGLDELAERFEKASTADLSNAVRKAILHVQAMAKANVRTASGELKGSILTEVKSTSNSVTGICYTDNEHAVYVEFGTGPVGQKNHAGISPEVHPTYHQTGWIIPPDAMSESQAEHYGLLVLKKEDGTIVGYATNGQPARPFLYPALKDHKDECMQIIRKELRKQL